MRTCKEILNCRARDKKQQQEEHKPLDHVQHANKLNLEKWRQKYVRATTQLS